MSRAPTGQVVREPSISTNGSGASDPRRDREPGTAAHSFVALVRSASSVPIEEALISTALLGAPDGDFVAVSTDAEGRVRIERPHEGSGEPLAVWASHPLHQTIGRVLDPRELGQAQPVEFALEPSPPLLVRVTDERGDPIAGAEIEQRAPTPELALTLGSSSSPTARAGLPVDVLATFARRLVADERGLARAHPCTFPIVLRARSATGVSRWVLVEPWEGEVELRVLATARALGTVHLPPDFGAIDELLVTCSIRPLDFIESSVARVLVSARVAPNGSWGPVDIPFHEGGSLVFRIEGGRLVPDEKEIDPRTTRAPFVVDFAPEVGLPLSVFVFHRDASGPRGIANARVEFLWRNEEQDRWLRVATWTSEDGRVELEGCPSTTGIVGAAAIGFSSAEVENVALPRAIPVEVELSAGGVLEGRCVHRGEGVRDFDVMVWNGLAREHSVHSFHDRADGSFHIDGVPFGGIQVLASAPSLPESGVYAVSVLPAEPARVVVELPDAAVGRGRVIDASTSEAISNARIVPLVATGIEVLAARGSSLPVESDGSFELAAFPPKDCAMRVEAAGYASLRVDGSYSAEVGVDFGEIALARAQDLSVRIISDSPFDAGELWFIGSGQTSIPFRAFPPHGELVIEGVAPGQYQLGVVWSSGDTISRTVQLVAGRPWIIEYEIDPEESLVVEIVPREGQGLPESAAVFAIYPSDDGEKVTRGFDLPPNGLLEFPGFPGQEVWIEVTSLDHLVLGTAHARFEDGEPRRVRVELADRSLVVRVVDADGEPLPEAQVDLATLDEDGGWSMFRDTDAKGRVIAHGLAFDKVVAHVYHPSAGSRSNLVIPLAAKGTTEFEVALTGGEDLRVRLVDGGEALSGVRVRLHPSVRSIFIADRQTGAEGIATWSRLSPGSYQAHVDHPGLWPSWHAFEFEAGGEPIALQVRSLGNLHVVVRSAEGAPIAGAAVELSSVELGERAADWAAENRIQVEPADFQTNAVGELRVTGIPRGAYELAVSLPSGEVLRQRVEVPRKSTLAHEMRAP